MKEKIIENGIEVCKTRRLLLSKCGEYQRSTASSERTAGLHKEFIKNHRKGFYSSLILQGKLDEYLYELNR